MGLEEAQGERVARRPRDRHTADELTDEYQRGRSDAADAVAAYAKASHIHVGVLKCWPESGDRCDITAALGVAVKIARGTE